MIKFSFLGAPFPYHHPLSLQIPARILETRLRAYQMVRNHVVLRITVSFQQLRFSSLHAWFLLPFGYISPDVFLSQSLHDYVTARSTHQNSQVCLDICRLSRHISRVADIVLGSRTLSSIHLYMTHTHLPYLLSQHLFIFILPSIQSIWIYMCYFTSVH